MTVATVAIGLLSSPLHADKEKGEESKDPEKISCKYTRVVNSRIPTKICLTNFEWEERRRAQIEAERTSGTGSSNCGETASGPCGS